MAERYRPASDFLNAVIDDCAPLSGSIFGEANLRLLIAMTGDDDLSNRDWATFLLAQEDFDTAEVRAALLRAACDEDPNVSAEAILGIARRDRDLALPFIRKALCAAEVSVPIFDAAEVVAHPILVDDLRRFASGAVDPYVAGALAACEAGLVKE
jgi:hypothetical protein